MIRGKGQAETGRVLLLVFEEHDEREEDRKRRSLQAFFTSLFFLRVVRLDHKLLFSFVRLNYHFLALELVERNIL